MRCIRASEWLFWIVATLIACVQSSCVLASFYTCCERGGLVEYKLRRRILECVLPMHCPMNNMSDLWDMDFPSNMGFVTMKWGLRKRSKSFVCFFKTPDKNFQHARLTFYSKAASGKKFDWWLICCNSFNIPRMYTCSVRGEPPLKLWMTDLALFFVPWVFALTSDSSCVPVKPEAWVENSITITQVQCDIAVQFMLCVFWQGNARIIHDPVMYT